MSPKLVFTLRIGLPLLVWLLVYWSSLESMVGVWANSKTYEHSYLIAPISLWLVWQKKEQVKNYPLNTAFLPILLLVLPCLLWIVGTLAGVAFFEHIAAITTLQLILWAVLGNQRAKLLLFPIFYLTFCIPFGEELIPYLQEVTAYLSVIMIRLSGVPVFREGMYLTIPNGQFEVAEACSGIRFLISSIALGTLFANFFFTQKWKLFLYVTFSCLFPIIANSIRAYGIIMIGYLSDMKYATGADHLIYGWVFFSIVIGIMFYIAWAFQDRVTKQETLNIALAKNALHYNLAPTLLIVTVLLSSSIWLNIIEKKSNSSESSTYLPSTQIKDSKLTNWKITLPPADQVSVISNQDNSATIFHAVYHKSKSRSDLINSKNSIYNKETWSINETIQLNINGNNATGVSLVNLNGNSKKIIYWHCINDYCSNNSIKLKFIKAYYLLTNQEISSSVTAVSSESLNFPMLEDNFLHYTSNDGERFANER
ncbi:exosortase A [Vibrio ziniensis]|uniref:Exosortase A n=1 Tax=Vibrio ziniensis TaxID=2711221 RepID=A0A6G7CQS1_9VIBR|nr:exosortase A [Vibrio ziniensis]QIH44501.1 exosortase A [Vibrio ziniensis]